MAYIIIGILGQSNGGCYGPVRCPGPWPGQVSFNYLNGQFSPWVDPLPGFAVPPGNNTGGSIWGRLGYLFHADPQNPWQDMICIAPLIKDAHSSAVWRPDGMCYPRIAALRASLAANNPPLQVGAWLWLNGETDAHETQMPYGYHTESVRLMVEGMRAAGDHAPVFTSVCTHCRSPETGYDYEAPAVSREGRLARLRRQADLQHEQALMPGVLCNCGVFPGPNHDLIRDRFDGCHFGDWGQWVAAEQWHETLKAAHAVGVI
jgi:hypothetical protein